MDHHETSEPEGQLWPGVTFHRLGVGYIRHRSADGGLVLPLDGMQEELGHRPQRISYLHTSLRGPEDVFLLQQLVDTKARLDRVSFLLQVDQLSLRLYLRPRVEEQLAWYWQLARNLRQLQAAGYQVVYSKPPVWATLWQFPGWPEPVEMEHDVLLVPV